MVPCSGDLELAVGSTGSLLPPPLAPSLQPPQVRETSRKKDVDRYMSSVINNFTLFLSFISEGTFAVLTGKLRHAL